MSRTPNFDKKINAILADLKPHTRKCRVSGDEYRVSGEDIEFSRKCDKTGKDLISIYRGDSPFTIWDERTWWQEDWDFTDYGQSYNAEQSFLVQLQKLRLKVPRPHIIGHPKDQNVHYSNHTAGGHNCYMTFVMYQNRDCMYSSFFSECQDCMEIAAPRVF